MTFRLVRAELSEAMDLAHFETHATSGKILADTTEIWAAMLAASEPLTDAEIDELRVAMWGEDEEPRRGLVAHEMWSLQRDRQRSMMRAFIASLEGHPK